MLNIPFALERRQKPNILRLHRLLKNRKKFIFFKYFDRSFRRVKYQGKLWIVKNYGQICAKYGIKQNCRRANYG